MAWWERNTPPRFRAGETHEGKYCRAKHPEYSWGFFAVEDNEEVNYDVPLHWVDDAPDDPANGAGHWVYAKDVD